MGKSTVAPIVASKLQREFVEMDAIIENESGMKITDIFASYGEEHFRQLEHALCQRLAQQKNLVISTGGGTLVDARNRELMLGDGFVVCLVIAEQVLEERLRRPSRRPLAMDWRNLYRQRANAYDQIPNTVEVTDKSPSRIATEIIELWQKIIHVKFTHK